MKKFLLILLLAIVICATDDAKEEILTAQQETEHAEKTETVESFLDAAGEFLQGIYKKIKKNQLWDKIINQLKNWAKNVALNICKDVTKEEEGCNELILGVDKRVEKF